MLPGGTVPLTGTWHARIRSTTGATKDADGTIRAGEDAATDIGDGVSMTLPAGAYDFMFRSNLKVGPDNGHVTLGWFPWNLTADATWGDILGTPVEVPVTPSDVTLAQAAADRAEAAAAAAQTISSGLGGIVDNGDGTVTITSGVGDIQTAVAAAATATAAAAAAQAVGNSNDTIIAGRINTAGSATQVALAAALDVPFKPNTAYAKGQVVVSPDTGNLVQAIAAFTSASTYSSADWVAALDSTLIPTRSRTGIRGFSAATELVARALGWVIVTDSRWAGGAKGDATADDTAAFTAALASLSPTMTSPGYAYNGGTVWGPPGRYKITSTLTLPPGVRLVGAGKGATEDPVNTSIGTSLLASTPGMTLLLITSPSGTPSQYGRQVTNLNLFDNNFSGGLPSRTCTLIRQFNTNRCVYENVAFHDANIGYQGESGGLNNVVNDCSWNEYRNLSFWNCRYAMAPGSTGGYGGNVFGCESNGADVAFDTSGEAGALAFYGTKADTTGHPITGAIGFRARGYGIQFFGCKAEMEGAGAIGFQFDGVAALRPAPPSGDANSSFGSWTVGHGSGVIGVQVTANATNTQVIGHRWDAVATKLDDAGVNTLVLDSTNGLLTQRSRPEQLVTSGQETMPRLAVQAAPVTLSSGGMRLAFFTSRKTEAVARIRVNASGAAAATPTLVRYGLYAVASSGVLTLIGSTPNDTSLLAAAGTTYSKALSAPAQLVAGQRYAVAVLVVSTATMPSLFGVANVGGISTESAQDPMVCGVVASQSDLPASIANGGVGASAQMLYAVVGP